MKSHPVQMEGAAGGIKSVKQDGIKTIDLVPYYSTNELPGKCIRCLAEEKLFNCMRELLRAEQDSSYLQEKYEALYTFLESPGLDQLCNETEKYLAEGKQVNVCITINNGKIEHKINLK